MFNNKIIDKKWLDIIDVHQCVKNTFIMSKKTVKSLDSFIQPFNEIRAVLEHIIGVQCSILDEKDENYNNNDFIIDNLDKALRHEYSIFYDICTWVSDELKRKLDNILVNYEYNNNISTLLDEKKDFYNKIDNFIIKNTKNNKNIDKEIINNLSKELLKLCDYYNEFYKKLYF